MGLKEFAENNPWLPFLVAGMLSNRLRDPKSIRTKLDNLSNKEALMMGQSLSVPLKARKVASTGVEVWINEYAALVQLRNKCMFFAPLAVTIGQRKLDQAIWGLALKVGIGATLSILDVGTDVLAIYTFNQQGKHGFANACIAMVSVSMAVQLLIVYTQGKKKGAKIVA